MNTQAPEKPVEILLIEDSPGDVRLTQEALKQIRTRVRLNVARNGEEALAYLRRQGTHSTAMRPDLILLDLNMLRKDGRAFLADVKADPKLHCIPVIVLTISTAEEDIVKCYKLQASCYIGKPLDVNKFHEVMHSIERFWLETAVLPKHC